MNIIFVIYVEDQKRSREFYQRILKQDPILDVEGMTEFKINENTKLGIMPESGIVKLLKNKIINPSKAKGVSRCEIYLYVDSPEEFYKRAILFGAKPISESLIRDWGDEVAYCVDFDGNVIAFARKIKS
jgi:predicted enzyme related to lactoylglutathione lyase